MSSEETPSRWLHHPPVIQVADHGSTSHYAERDLNVYYGPDAAPLLVDPIANRELFLAEQLFVPQARYPDALRTLESRHLVVLYGSGRAGKRSTAVRLLWEHARGLKLRQFELELRQFRTDWDKPKIERLPVEERCGYLLDLSGETAPLAAEIASSLLTHRDKLMQAQSCMVVTATDTVLKRCQEKLHDFAVQIEPPDAAITIASKRLESDFGKPERVAWLKVPEVAELLPPGTRPVDAVRMAQAISHAPEDKAQGIDHAVAEFTGWKDELLNWFKKHEAPFARAALITAALLEPADSRRDICLRAMKLVTKVEGESPPELSPLRADDLSTRLDGIELHKVGNMVSLTKMRSGFNEAVLDHVWEERPELHDAFRAWVLDMAADKETGSVTLTRIAKALTGMSVRSSSAGFLVYVKNWVVDSSKHTHLAQAMLEETAVNPVVGLKVRRKLLDWAQGANPQLAEVTARVCGGDLGELMTDIAMTRLLHILRHQDASARNAAKQSLVRLADNDALRLRVLRTIVGWMKNKTEATAAASAVAFLTVVTDKGLVPKFLRDTTADEVMHQTLSDGWQYLSDSEATQTVIVDAMALWMITAQIEGNKPQHVLAILDKSLRQAVIHSLPRELYFSVHKQLGHEADLPRVLFDQIQQYYQTAPPSQEPCHGDDA